MGSYQVPCAGCGCQPTATLCECTGLGSIFAEFQNFQNDASGMPYENVLWASMNGVFACPDNVVFDEINSIAYGERFLGTYGDTSDRGVLVKVEYAAGDGVITRQWYVWKIKVELSCTGSGETLLISGSISLLIQTWDDETTFIGEGPPAGEAVEGTECFVASTTGTDFGATNKWIGYVD